MSNAGECVSVAIEIRPLVLVKYELTAVVIMIGSYDLHLRILHGARLTKLPGGNSKRQAIRAEARPGKKERKRDQWRDRDSH